MPDKGPSVHPSISYTPAVNVAHLPPSPNHTPHTFFPLYQGPSTFHIQPRDEIFMKLLKLLVHSVLFYLAEVCGCSRQLDPIERVQMKATGILLGVGRLHPKSQCCLEETCVH